MTKIAINGFGRIGRLCLRHILENHPELEVVAINDLSPAEILIHLFKYDSSYGIYNKEIKSKFFCEREGLKYVTKLCSLIVILKE
jgi:glyceraldehyde 3-phosphate dehydrogenase